MGQGAPTGRTGPTSGRHSGPQGRGRFLAVRLHGAQAQGRQRCERSLPLPCTDSAERWDSRPEGTTSELGVLPAARLRRAVPTGSRRSLAAVTTLHLRRSASAPTHARRGEPTGPIMNISPGGGSSGDPSRPNSHRAASRPSSLRFGRNTPGIPPSRALSAGRLATLGAHATLPTGCYGPAVRSEVR